MGRESPVLGGVTTFGGSEFTDPEWGMPSCGERDDAAWLEERRRQARESDGMEREEGER